MFGTIAIYFQRNSESDNENQRLCRRRIRDSTNVLEIPDERFVANFRINKEVFLVLLKETEPHIKTSYRSTHIPPINKLATFLTFLATGSYQASIGNEYVSSMSKSEVSKAITECLDIFENIICNKWIRLEKTGEEENAVKEAFHNAVGIPGIVGCVDGTHVRMKSPGDDLKHLYYNRKGFYSINVMLICDHNMVITYVDARHPGSNHDAFIWEQSAANLHFKSNYMRGKRNTCLLADSGYKLQPYMMTPYRNPTTQNERRFNERQIKGRNIIERTIGVLKNRFRSIIGSRGLHYSPEKTTKIINACCALHNICIFYKNNYIPCEVVNEYVDEDAVEETYEESSAANSVRNDIARNLS